eukprot:CAMPEP_0174268468 /NCGR_PEP_ID=MMETSP0439-20130205/37590_1 /TAXON_ID=0 /ORGANISM="Stereomyxa ramosa, Strain Chinc5" /LENGTH=688 /DNA_ID=CAMNT_0015356665 /DNA_START=63 /DNA_END=2129 /DNA_ORIENTATION=+
MRTLLVVFVLIGLCHAIPPFLREVTVPLGSINQLGNWIQQVPRASYLDCPTNENRFGLTCDAAATSRDDLDNYFCGSNPDEYGWCGDFWKFLADEDVSVPASTKRGVSNGALVLGGDGFLHVYQTYMDMFMRVCSCHCGCSAGCGAAGVSGWGHHIMCGGELLCGNGVLDASEQCDDGNTVSGDGCSSSCQLELIAINAANLQPVYVLYEDSPDGTIPMGWSYETVSFKASSVLGKREIPDVDYWASSYYYSATTHSFVDDQIVVHLNDPNGGEFTMRYDTLFEYFPQLPKDVGDDMLSSFVLVRQQTIDYVYGVVEETATGGSLYQSSNTRFSISDFSYDGYDLSVYFTDEEISTGAAVVIYNQGTRKVSFSSEPFDVAVYPKTAGEYTAQWALVTGRRGTTTISDVVHMGTLTPKYYTDSSYAKSDVDGKLVLTETFAGTGEQTDVVVSLRKQFDTGVYEAYYELSGVGDAPPYLAQRGFAIEVDNTMSTTDRLNQMVAWIQEPGTMLLGSFSITDPTGTVQVFGFDGQPDGTVANFNSDTYSASNQIFHPAPDSNAVHYFWSSDGVDSIQLTTHYNYDVGWYDPCNPVDANCFEIRRRTWTPLRFTGNRVYVLEKDELNYDDGNGWFDNIAPRINFYEKVGNSRRSPRQVKSVPKHMLVPASMPPRSSSIPPPPDAPSPIGQALP